MSTSTSLGAPAPAPERQPAPLRPRPLPRHPEGSPRKAWWLGSLAILVVIGMVAWWQREAFSPGAGKGRARPAFRTVTVTVGDLVKSIRVSGVTSAERFTVLRAPQMQGSRRGRSGKDVRQLRHPL